MKKNLFVFAFIISVSLTCNFSSTFAKKIASPQTVTRAEFINKLWLSTETAAMPGDFLPEVYKKCHQDFYSHLDVKPNLWYSNTLEGAYCDGIITGYKDWTIRPNQAITRAEASEILYKFSDQRVLGAIRVISYEDKNKYSFRDVKDSDWFSSSISMSFYLKLLQPTSENTFSPHENITSVEASQMITNYHELTEDLYNNDLEKYLKNHSIQ